MEIGIAMRRAANLNVSNKMAGNYIVLLLTCMDKAPNTAINWHITAFVCYEWHY